MSRTTARVRVLLVRLGFAFGRIRPLARRVVLATAHANRLEGNLWWIHRDLATRHPHVPIIVLARRPPAGPWGLARAAIDAVYAGYHLARSRVFIVDDYYFPMYAIHPMAGTSRIQVWHAAGAFKRFGYSLASKSFGASEGAVAEFPIHTNYDLCLVSAARFAPFYAEAFRQPIERFSSRHGIPRTDLFFDEAERSRATEAVRKRYRLPAGKRVLLYAPTFRGTAITSAISPDDLDVAAMRAALGTDHILLLRSHPFVGGPRRERALDGFAIDVSDHSDINELMLVSDMLITDYSSAMYEFSLLDRPIAFLAPDRAAYEAERGFYLDYPADLPGPAFDSTDALAAFIRAGEFDLARVRRFRADSFDVADGRATRRIVDEVVLPALG